MSHESIKPSVTTDNSLVPRLGYFNNSKFQVEYNGSCLKPDRVSFAPKKTIKLCNTFEIKSWTFHVDNDFRLGKW